MYIQSIRLNCPFFPSVGSLNHWLKESIWQASINYYNNDSSGKCGS